VRPVAVHRSDGRHPSGQQLLDLSAAADTAYRAAVEALYQAPRTFVTGRLKSLRTPVFSVR